ncbi:OmpA family protein [Flavobacteriaceae bacterium R33]|uniref:OmpA family protein n=1 Tax=Poritiphilus flavus TaxID=2697053 RepID=A0A6L9E8V5_9FLAO|nr:OmpA family protein [Poritiphilus flavus]
MLWVSDGSAQNLVKNPSFEEYEKCPSSLGNFASDVAHWSTPTHGSTDYFNSCSKAMGTPKNFNGEQPSDFGKGYAGLYLYAPDDYREYIQVALTETLKKGVSYELSFYVSLAERSDYAVKDFGVLFSRDELVVDIKKTLSRMHLYRQQGNAYNSMEIGYTNFYRDTKDWILVNTRFEAKGTENYMTIGNFQRNNRTRKFKTKRDARKGAYYYIDMVELRQIRRNQNDAETAIAELPTQTPDYELDKSMVFENVLFSFDKYELKSEAKEELSRIYEYLRTDTSLMIYIEGHTDTKGGKSYNQRLSENRCLAVADFMKSLGLEADRLRWKGLGGSRPIADNATEEGRRQNRRVEFVISKAPIR